MPVDNKPFQKARIVGGPYTRAEKLAIEYENNLKEYRTKIEKLAIEYDKKLKETYTKIEDKDAEISRLRAIIKLVRHTGL